MTGARVKRQALMGRMGKMTVEYLKRGKPEADRAEDDAKVATAVATTLKDIEMRGDEAVHELAVKFDNYDRPTYRLTEDEVQTIIATVSKRDMEDIKFAQEQVRNFAQAQRDSMLDIEVETLPGVILGHKNIPVQSVGCYVPGGKFPMVASAHMSVATASVAGVPRIIAATPPFNGEPNPAVIAAMHLGGAHEIYVLGGIQAVGAMALGTQSIDPVHLLVGPGNAYVAAAKKQVFGQVGIDMIAGPSEILVVSDTQNDPAWMAADLLSQAEHDEVAQSIFICDDADYADAVEQAVETALETLPRAAIARKSWQDFGAILVVDDLAREAPALINQLAPEHLELAVQAPEAMAGDIRHAGSIFMGRYTPEAVGDYIAGPNHVLPTARAARYASGLSVLNFMKRTSLVKCDAASLSAIGPAAVQLADEEGLDAHGRSISIRLNIGQES